MRAADRVLSVALAVAVGCGPSSRRGRVVPSTPPPASDADRPTSTPTAIDSAGSEPSPEPTQASAPAVDDRLWINITSKPVVNLSLGGAAAPCDFNRIFRGEFADDTVTIRLKSVGTKLTGPFNRMAFPGNQAGADA